MNIVAEYGKLHFKLRKLKQLDQQRIKLIQQIAAEASDMELGENARFIFDLPGTSSQVESTSESSHSGLIDEELLETLNQLESMASYLDKGVTELFESGKMSSLQCLESASSIPDEKILCEFLQDDLFAYASGAKEGESKKECDHDDVLSKEIRTSKIQNLLCQWEDQAFCQEARSKGTKQKGHFETLLAELRQKNEGRRKWPERASLSVRMKFISIE